MVDAAWAALAAASSAQPPDSERLVVGPMQVVPDELLVVVEGARLWLPPRQMDVLGLLARHPDTLLERAMIFEAVWGRAMTHPRDRSVDTQITRLRRGLAEIAPDWEFIHTHHGHGYRLDARPRSQP